MGIGDWGLGIGDWAQSPIPNPQEKIIGNYKFFFKFQILNILFIKYFYFKIREIYSKN
jgi:hypothetical protein